MAHTTTTGFDSASLLSADRTPDTTERLTISDLARALADRGFNRSLVNRYDANDELRSLLGKKGTTYPGASMRYWESIAEARQQEPPLVRPETAGVFLRSLIEQAGEAGGLSGVRSANDSISSRNGADQAAIALTGQEISLVLSGQRSEVFERFTAALEGHTRALEAAAAPDDALLDAAGVRALVPMSANWLRRNVPSVRLGRRRLWRQSDVYRFIDSLKRG